MADGAIECVGRPVLAAGLLTGNDNVFRPLHKNPVVFYPLLRYIYIESVSMPYGMEYIGQNRKDAKRKFF